MKKAPKILYFIAGSVPTDEDVAAAEELGGNVKFRNAEFVDADSPNTEACDGVAGADITDEKGKVVGSVIPQSYRKYPDAEKVLAAYKSGKELPKAKEPKPEAKAEDGKGGDAKTGAGWQGGK